MFSRFVHFTKTFDWIGMGTSRLDAPKLTDSCRIYRDNLCSRRFTAFLMIKLIMRVIIAIRDNDTSNNSKMALRRDRAAVCFGCRTC